MDLSIIIINWNSAHYLKKCLYTVYGIANLDYEILVIDNGSFDGAAEMVKQDFPGVRFLQSENNLGFANANNLAFEQSTGRNVLFLNPDTEMTGNALRLMCSTLDSLTGAGAIGCKLLNSDLTVQTSCIQAFPSLLNQILDAEWIRNRCPKSRLWGMRALYEVDPSPVTVDVISGACLLVRRSVFEEVGRFTAEYFFYAEDVDLCYKIHRAGYYNYYLGNAVVIHHGGTSTVAHGSGFAAVMGRESTLIFMRRNHGKGYALGFQVTTAVVAAFRLLLLSPAFLLSACRMNVHSLRGAYAKWSRILMWAVGLGGWAGGRHLRSR